MFLHIGADYSVPVKDIVLILDCEKEIPESTREALNALKSVNAGDIRRCAVITPGIVYYSPMVKGTLRKRLEHICRLQS